MQYIESAKWWRNLTDLIFSLPLHQLLSTYVATMYSLQQSDRTLAETSESYSN